MLFIVLGNTAGNAIIFAQYILRAQKYSQEELDNPSHELEWLIKGLAVSAITGACLLHGLWRAGGILINNVFATIKCCFLLVFIAAGFAFSAGVGHVPKPSPSNLDPTISFMANVEGGARGKVYGYSQSLLLVIFAYSGYENANLVSKSYTTLPTRLTGNLVSGSERDQPTETHLQMGKHDILDSGDCVVHVDEHSICEVVSSPTECFVLLTGDNSFLLLTKTILKIRVHSWRYYISIMCIISIRGTINQLHAHKLLDLWRRCRGTKNSRWVYCIFKLREYHSRDIRFLKR